MFCPSKNTFPFIESAYWMLCPGDVGPWPHPVSSELETFRGPLLTPYSHYGFDKWEAGAGQTQAAFLLPVPELIWMLQGGGCRRGVGLFAGCVLLGAPLAAVLWDPCLFTPRSSVCGLLSAPGLIWAQGGSTEHKQHSHPSPEASVEFGELKEVAPLMPRTGI